MARLVPEVVIAHVELYLAEVDIRHMSTDLVEKVPVVGNDDNGIGKADEILFEPGDGLEIQVIGRLIEQQNVRVSEKRLCEQHPHLVAPLQFLHFFGAHLFGYAKAV